MRQNHYPGKLVVIEGLDGSGTTTQLNLLRNATDAIFTCEPTDGEIGKLIRRVLRKELPAYDEKTMALLYAADRTDHIHNQQTGLLKELKKGRTVITDRYVLSSLAYQGRTLGFDAIWQMNSDALSPDITIYLDIEPEEAALRMKQRQTLEELYETLDQQKEIRAKYLRAINYLRSKGETVVVLDGMKPIPVIHNAIMRYL